MLNTTLQIRYFPRGLDTLAGLTLKLDFVPDDPSPVLSPSPSPPLSPIRSVWAEAGGIQLWVNDRLTLLWRKRGLRK